MANVSSKPSKPSEDTFLNVDALIAEASWAPFPFRLDGEKVELPHVQTLSTEQGLRIQNGEPLEVLTTLLGEERGRRLMQLPAFAMNAILDGWLNHSGADSGEGSASSSS